MPECTAPGGAVASFAVVKVPTPTPLRQPIQVVVLDVNEPAALTSLHGAADVYSLGLRGFTTDGDVPLDLSRAAGRLVRHAAAPHR